MMTPFIIIQSDGLQKKYLFNIMFIRILTFSKQAFNEFLDFWNRSWPREDINLIDIYQAHLPVQYASNIESIRQT